MGGYDFVSTGPSFTKSKMYWKGGAVAFDAFAGPYFKAHPDMAAMLNKTREENPACESAAPHSGNGWVWVAVVVLGVTAFLICLICLILRRVFLRRRTVSITSEAVMLEGPSAP